ncbi:hypothetical protein E4U55_006497 [Claviceps digitariae]|nr:hypothetical protein E4U55_006497 [Claviceps digitariae]
MSHEQPQQAEESSASASLVERDPCSQQHIQARDSPDVDSDAEDSALGDDDASTTTSLRSSILQYREENGRTYHSFAESINYVLPNDQPEQDRLDLQHHLFSMTLGGKLYKAPLDELKISRVLDAGTGTGIWAIDIGDELPNAEVLGVDISPIQPTFVPPNVSFVLDDLEMEWAYRRPFDFVFGRMLVGSIGDWPKFIQQSFENLNSGGWIELQDIIVMPKCDDGTMSEDSAIKLWGDRMLESCDILGRYGDSALRYKQQMIDAGFINVTEVQYKWPTNPWAAEQHYRDLGTENKQTRIGQGNHTLNKY